MEGQMILALALAIPVILFPAAFVWYLNIGGIFTVIKEAREKLAAREKGAGVEVQAKQTVAVKEEDGNTEERRDSNGRTDDIGTGTSDTCNPFPGSVRLVPEHWWYLCRN